MKQVEIAREITKAMLEAGGKKANELINEFSDDSAVIDTVILTSASKAYVQIIRNIADSDEVPFKELLRESIDTLIKVYDL